MTPEQARAQMYLLLACDAIKPLWSALVTLDDVLALGECGDAMGALARCKARLDELVSADPSIDGPPYDRPRAAGFDVVDPEEGARAGGDPGGPGSEQERRP